MSVELTNLLPPERIRSLRQLYFFRLATVGMLVLVGVAGIHAVLLLPSYLFLQEQVKGREAVLASLTATLAGSEEREVSARVAKLTEDAAHLARLAEAPAASTAIAAILKLPRPGIGLRGFTFTRATEGKEPSMSVSGVASSREKLRAFEQSLAAQPYVTSTELPISAYAKESDIDFTITLTGSLIP